MDDIKDFQSGFVYNDDLGFIEDVPDELNDDEVVAKIDDELYNEIQNIPQQMAFKIGDVTKATGIKQYVLRYWESEFDLLRPRKARNKQRMYSRKDVETILIIKKLLYRDKYSIEGAKTAVRDAKKELKNWNDKPEAQSPTVALDPIRDKLKAILSDIESIREEIHA